MQLNSSRHVGTLEVEQETHSKIFKHFEYIVSKLGDVGDDQVEPNTGVKMHHQFGVSTPL